MVCQSIDSCCECKREKEVVFGSVKMHEQALKAPKYKIESMLAALQVVEKEEFMFSFDLKLAYH